jgi:cytidylate kinase
MYIFLNMVNLMHTPLIIAIDGTSASGKGTIAKGLASHFNFAHLDTGLLYRAVGFAAIEQFLDFEKQKQAIIDIAKTFTAEWLENPALKYDEISVAASKVAVIPEVREALLDFQKAFATNPLGGAKGAVLDGRDIGTVICPNAPVKFFVTAHIEVRAKRRFDELINLGRKVTFEQVLQDLQQRDERDMNRKDAPLKKADDAHLLDNTNLSIRDVIAEAATIVSHVMDCVE